MRRVHCGLFMASLAYMCWLLKFHYQQWMVLRQHYMLHGGAAQPVVLIPLADSVKGWQACAHTVRAHLFHLGLPLF